MQRNIFALVVGTALLGGAALAACSSGGGSSPTPTLNAGTLSPGGSQLSSTNGTTFTFTINRSPVKKATRKHQSTQRTHNASRQPEYFSQYAQGLQVAVIASGVTGVTKYVDISSGSSLCSTSGGFETCTITIPTIAPTENITVTEVDTTPNHEGTNGNPAGYGDSFPTTSNILAVGTATSTSSGATTFAMALGPVLAQVEDCFYEFGTMTPTATTNAAMDGQTSNVRLVVTAGVAQTVYDLFCFFDADNSENYAGGTPEPVVDVNGSATPVTFTSNSQHVLVGLYNSESASPTPVPSAQTASMADTSLLFAGNCIAYELKLDGNLAQPATLTVSNNLTTTNSTYTNANYAQSSVVTIVPLSITATPAPISQSLYGTTTVTASDYEGTNGLTPFASVQSNGTGNQGGQCVDSGSTVRATVTSAGAINTGTWLQSFTIIPATSPTVTVPVTCTFVLADVNAGETEEPGYVVTPPITVTVTP